MLVLSLSFFASTTSSPAFNPQRSSASSAVSLPSSRPVSLDDLPGLLPAGQLQVDIMDTVAPKGMEELSQRLIAAMKKDPDYFARQLAAVGPGEPLPYDPKLGLSEKEYQQFLAMSKQMRLSKTGQATLLVKRNDKGQVSISSLELPELDVTIDFTARTVKTPLGLAEKARIVQARTEDGAPADWDGFEWRMEQQISLPARSAASASFALGRCLDGKTGVIHYRADKTENGARTQSTRLMLFFPVGKEKN